MASYKEGDDLILLSSGERMHVDFNSLLVLICSTLLSGHMILGHKMSHKCDTRTLQHHIDCWQQNCCNGIP